MAWKFNDNFAAQEAALKRAMKRATKTTTNKAKPIAQANAPVKTGRLRASAQVVDANQPTLGVAETVIAFPVEYATLVHNGSMGGTEMSGAESQKGFRAPRPFLTDALAASEDDLAATTEKELLALGAKRVRRYR